MAFAGNLATLALPDVLTTLHNIRATGILRLDSRVGSRDIVLCEGRIEGVAQLDEQRSQGLDRRIAQLVRAPPKGSDDETKTFRAQAADEAIHQLGNLLAWGQGDFAFHGIDAGDPDVKSIVEHCLAHPLNLNTNQVLMESARQQDEWAELRARIATTERPSSLTKRPTEVGGRTTEVNVYGTPTTRTEEPSGTLATGRAHDEDEYELDSSTRPPTDGIALVRTDRADAAHVHHGDPGHGGEGTGPVATVNLDTLARLAREHGAEIAKRQEVEEKLRIAEDERAESLKGLRELQSELRELYDKLDQRNAAAGKIIDPGAVTRRDLRRVARRLREMERGYESGTRRLRTQSSTSAPVGDQPIGAASSGGRPAATTSPFTPAAGAAPFTAPFPAGNPMAAPGALSGPHIAIPTKEIERIQPGQSSSGSHLPMLMPAGGPPVAPGSGLIPVVSPERSPPPPPPAAKPTAWPTGRIIRVTVGVGLLLIALFAVVVPLFFPISSMAAVNARVAVMTAPIEGAVSPTSAAEGKVVDRGQPVATITNDRVDTSRLDGLNAQKQQIDGKRTTVETELRSRERTLQQQRTEFDNYRRLVVADLETALASQEALARKHDETAAARRADYDRLSAVAQDAVARRQLDEARATTAAAERDRDVQARAVERARSRLQAARAGVFLEGDQPPQLSRIQDETSRIDELRGQLDSLAAQLEPVERELAAERDRIAKLRSARIDAPIGGRLWRTEVTSGQWVRSGAPLFSVADMDSVVVEAWFPQRHMDVVAPGDACDVHLLGSGRIVRGTVVDIAVPDQNRPDETLATRLDPKDPRAFRVRIRLKATDTANLEIGQRAKVLITGDSSGIIRRSLLQICAWMEF